MTNASRPSRKGTDQEIIALNSLGLSQVAIGKLLDCHPTAISTRLKAMHVAPADTRRAFMESIFLSLDEASRNAVAQHLAANAPMTIKDYVRGLVLADVNQQSKDTTDHVQGTV